MRGRETRYRVPTAAAGVLPTFLQGIFNLDNGRHGRRLAHTSIHIFKGQGPGLVNVLWAKRKTTSFNFGCAQNDLQCSASRAHEYESVGTYRVPAVNSHRWEPCRHAARHRLGSLRNAEPAERKTTIIKLPSHETKRYATPPSRRPQTSQKIRATKPSAP